jgi:NitT/TauT family transport system substrate-binding protein
MAKNSGATSAEFKAQLATTAMFYKAADATAFATGPDLKKTMDHVRTFSFDKGLFGKGAKDKDFVGIAFPDGSVLGNAKNIKLRFDTSFMKMAADGKL